MTYKCTWRRGEVAIKDKDGDREGTVSIFFNWNLWSWCFGLYIEPDPGWLEIRPEFGPVNLSIIYWRWRWSVPLES